jgi:hypothetical protein
MATYSAREQFLKFVDADISNIYVPNNVYLSDRVERGTTLESSTITNYQLILYRRNLSKTNNLNRNVVQPNHSHYTSLIFVERSIA